MDSTESILNSIKKLHGISAADTSFDPDIIIHINSALMVLNQIGVGPSNGFFIGDSTTTWHDYVPDDIIVEAVKTFVYIKVRLVFDPPASPTVVEALRESAREYEWRINHWAEQNTLY
jgi:hypothetical protein